MLMSGIIVMAGSAISYFWASNYISQNALKVGLGSLIGQSDPTYTLANTFVSMSPFAFLLGAALLIVGLVRRKSKGEAPAK
jgi:hypothetical protein